MSDDAVVARVEQPACRCGEVGWTRDALGDRTCRACNTVYTTRQESLREIREGKWTRGQRFYTFPADDPSDETTIIVIWTGPDDQRPDHDPVSGYYRPLCVAQIMPSGGLYNYVKYCGHCRHKWEDEKLGWSHCPYCGSGIANYVFSDGVLDGKLENLLDSLPDVWPVDRTRLWDGAAT